MATPLVLSMGWSRSPLLFCNVIETISDMTNASIRTHFPQQPHTLDDRAHALLVPFPIPNRTALTPTCVTHLSSRDPYLHQIKSKPLAYIDVCLNDFSRDNKWPIPLRCKVFQALSRYIDRVFCHLDGKTTPPKKRSSP